MNRLAISLSIMTLCSTLMMSCDQSESKNSPQVVPTPRPAQTVTPTPPPSEPNFTVKYADPAPGFTYEDLLKKSFCTVTLEGSEQTFLASEVFPYSDATIRDDAIVTYYFLEAGQIKESGTHLVSKIRSNCDLASLKDTPAKAVLLSKVNVYANKELEGEPICSFEPGSESFDRMDVAVVRDGIELTLNGVDCASKNFGYLKEFPAYLHLYRTAE